MTASPMIDIRPAGARAVTATDWLDSRHSFAFGAHYDPANTGFALLVVSNDDVLAPGAGFGRHPHRDLEIITWVLEGELLHEDDRGNRQVVPPGVVQRLSAGTGVVHDERNASTDRPVRLVQMWVTPDRSGVPPSYAVGRVGPGLVRAVSGRRDGVLDLHQRDAVLWVGQLAAGERVQLPEAPAVHLYVATGSCLLEEAGPLGEGDAVRLRSAGRRELTARGPAQVLVWEMHSPAG